jgi:hypothetical protein
LALYVFIFMRMGFCEPCRKFSPSPDLGKHDFTAIYRDRGVEHQLTQARRCEGLLSRVLVAPVKDRDGHEERFRRPA